MTDSPPASPIETPSRNVRWAVLGVLALVCLHPVVSPAMALGGGLVVGLAGWTPDPKRVSWLSSRLLKACVVGLGFGVSLAVVLRAGASGIVETAVSLSLTLALGFALGRLLRVPTDTSVLVSGGTAVCGGSAIAALGPAIGAGADAMGVALACVFVLNGVALYAFPAIGHALALTQEQFGTWAALAIHDTSSVVGAAASYGDRALELATVLKLTRALWIVPLVVVAAAWQRRRVAARADGADGAPAPKIAWPVFIAVFVAASAARALLPAGVEVFDMIADVARRGLVVALLLIGASLTRPTLARVGARPLLQAVGLWVVISAAALAYVMLAV